MVRTDLEMLYRILFYCEWYCFASTVVWWIRKPTIWAVMENLSLEVLWLSRTNIVSIIDFVLNLLASFAFCVLPSSGVLVSVCSVYHPQDWMRQSRWPRGLRPMCAGWDRAGGMDVCILCMLCVVEASATHRSLVQGSPTGCACSIECDKVKQ
jgi:hypothetical protein